MGGAGPCAGRVGHGIPHEQFLFLKVSCKLLAYVGQIGQMDNTFKSVV